MRLFGFLFAALILGACTTNYQTEKESPEPQIKNIPLTQPVVTFETTEANRNSSREKKQPVLLRGHAHTYPAAQSLRGKNGWVLIAIEVLENGTVGNTGIQSSSNKAFHAAAIKAVRTYQYEPLPHSKTYYHRLIFKSGSDADHYQPTTTEQ